ncbi:MAG: hypothetical protein FWG33_05015 [Oscillospiraceae bacterium]|nr:hypothetical protein [Oscillospiraceae bacterium]
MKTALIDRSLVGMEFNDNFSNDKKILFMYVCALIEAGASYLELDFNSVMRLPKPSGAENYIFRINRPEEFVVANALNFAYVVIPLKFSYILPKVEIPAILEIETGDADVFDVLQIVSSNIDLTPYSMLRLVGDFEPDSIHSMINTYRRRTIIPVDICPKNTGLTALNSAISAIKSDSDAVTARFGDSKSSASLEEVLIMLASMHKIIVSPNYLEGICKASLFLSMFSVGTDCSNLALMMKKYMYGTHRIENVDVTLSREEADLRRIISSSNRGNLLRKTLNRNPAERVLTSLGIEREMTEQIIKVINNCNVEIFKRPATPPNKEDLQ